MLIYLHIVTVREYRITWKELEGGELVAAGERKEKEKEKDAILF